MGRFDDIEASVYEWLPLIGHHFPGSGITPFNVWDLSFRWWMRYVAEARELVKGA